MSNKKSYSSEGIGRIWKSTLAKAVDSTTHRPRKDHSRTTPMKTTSLDDKNDELNPFILKALHSIRSQSGCEKNSSADSQEPCVEQNDIEPEVNSEGQFTKDQVEISRSNPLPLKINFDHDKDSRKRHGNGFYSAPHLRAYKEHEIDHKLEKENVCIKTTQTSQERVISKSKSSVRRSDTSHNRHREFENRDTSPPRFRNRRSEGALSESTVHFSERSKREVHYGDDVRKVETSDVSLDSRRVDKDDCGENKELDAYDRWKIKRQERDRIKCEKSALVKVCRDEDLGKHSKVQPSCKQNKSIDSDSPDTSKTSHNSTGHQTNEEEICQTQNTYLKDAASENNGAKKERESSIDSTNSFVDVEDHNVDDVSDDNDPSSPLQTSAMDKIQNLFASYTSPVISNRPEKRSAEKCVKMSHKKRDHSPPHTKVSQGEDPSKETPRCHTSALQDEQVSIENEFSSQSYAPEEWKESHKHLEEDNNSLDDACNKKDLRLVTEGDMDNSSEEIKNRMQDVHISINDKYDNRSEHYSHTSDQLSTYQEVYADDHSITGNTSKSSLNSKFLTKSPTSIPSGFSSDYDVGVVSQSDVEDEESPHPCATNLFPSHPHSQHETDRHQSASHWQGYYSKNSMSWPGPYLPPHYPSPYYHGHYPHPRIPPQSYTGSVGVESSFTSHTPRSSSSHATTLTVPAETFRNKESLDKVMDFVSAKTEEWNNFVSYHHGHTVPVDVVISVMLPGVKESHVPKEASIGIPPSPYPTPGWQLPMYQSHMGYYPPYWQHPYHLDTENVTHPGSQALHEPHIMYDKEAQSTDKEMKTRESLRRAPHGYHHHPSEHCPEELNEIPEYPHTTQPYPDTTNSDSLYSTSDITGLHPSRNSIHLEDDMKRRAISSEAGSDSEVAEHEKTTDRKSKKIRKSGDYENSSCPNEKSSRDNREENPKSCSHSKSIQRNSVSSFLNPNDMRNDWTTPPKSSSSISTKRLRYDQYSSPIYPKEKERDNIPQPDTNSSYNQSGDRNNCLKVLNQESIGADHVSRSWADECSEPRSDKNSVSSLEQFGVSPDSGSSSQGYFNSYHRRRSDSVISYSSEDRSPIAKDNRLCKTPGTHRDRKFPDSDSWKRSLISRSKTYSHQFIDTHCHIDFMYHRIQSRTIPFKQFVEEHSDSFPVNYEGCVAVFCNPKVFNVNTPAHHILQMLAKEDSVWVAVGCHPKNAMDFRSYNIVQLKRILQEHTRVVALGEIGLDYSGSFHQHADRQKEVFIQQLQLAIELNLPIVIHCRDADKDCLEIMKKIVPVRYKIHLHCFTRHISIARQYMDHFPNLFVGFTPLITYSSAKEATQAAELIPLDRLLLETDTPYFIPTGVPPAQVKGVSHPGLALFTAERLAQLRGISVDKVLEACRKNTRAMYGI